MRLIQKIGNKSMLNRCDDDMTVIKFSLKC